VNAVKIHIANLEGMGIGFKPKHHQLMEHAAKLLKHGDVSGQSTITSA